MTNYLGLQIGKSSLNDCVPTLFQVNRRAGRKNILLDVVLWVVQLNNNKHNIRNSRRVFHNHFVQLKQETRNPSKNVAYFIISDLFQDIVQIKNSCFWKMIANCASVGLTSFSSDKFTPICLVLHTDYPPRYRERDCRYIRSIFIIIFLWEFLWEFSFRQSSTLQSIL